jgi:uncharacterized protein (TIGR03437 family)
VAQSFVVGQATQTITFNAPANVVFGSAPITLTATASSNLSVTYVSTTPAVCTVSGSTLTLVGGGTCSITASQSGNANYLAAANVVQPFTVGLATQTITFTAPANVLFGSTPITLNATASSNLPVTYVSTTPAVCTVAGSALTLVAGGTCSITASQAGNANYLAAANVAQSFVVGQATQTITFNAPANVLFGSTPITLTATASSNLPVTYVSTTPAVCTVAGSTLTLVGGGTCSITASQAGNANYLAAASVVQSFTVGLATQTITFIAPANVVFGSTPITLTATASSNLAVTYVSTTPAICTVTGSALTLVGGGTCSITASQAGNANYLAAANVVQSFTVNKATQVITFPAPGGITLGSGSVTLSASASSGLAVVFATTTPAVCAVSGSSASGIAVGNCTVTANQAGDSDYNAAATVSATFAISPPPASPQTITFAPLSDVPMGTAPFGLSAAASSGLPLTFSSNNPAVCTVSGSTVVIVAPGTCSVTASQGGNASNQPATPVTQTFQVLSQIVISTNSLPVATVNQVYGPVSLGASGGSGGITWSVFAGSLPAGISLSGNGSLGGTPTGTGLFSFTVKATDGTSSAVQGLSIQVSQALSIVTASLPNAVQNSAYNQSLSATGGSGNYSWSVASGSLPSGITLSAAGVLGGTASAAGTFAFTAQVSDGTGSVTKGLSLQVGSLLSITTSGTLPGGATGTPYSVSLAAAGGTGGPYKWSVVSGSLPGGLSLTSAGNLTGNPGTKGTFSFTARVSDGNSTLDFAASITIYGAIVVTTSSLPNPVAGQPYDPLQLQFSGGSGQVVWSATGLPAGMALSAAGVLSGTPTGSVPPAGAVSNAAITATDQLSGQILVLQYSITVVPFSTSLKLNPGSLILGAAVNGAVSGAFTATGGTAPYVFSAAGLPAGITLGSNGSISGSSSVAGNFPATVTVTDASNAKVTSQLSIRILGLAAATLPAGAATVSYSATFVVTGGTPPYVFSGSGVPAGLSVSGAGVLGGTAVSPGTSSFNIQVNDSLGLSTSATYSLTIRQAPVSVKAPSLPDAVSGAPYTQTLTAIGGNPPYSWSLLSGALPTGLSLSASGTISGNPSVPGTSVFAVQATDASGGVASAGATILVKPTPIVISSGALPSGVTGSGYPQQVLGASGGVAPYVFSITSGGLPPGMSLTNGVISGTPTLDGTFPFTVTVADAAGNHANSALSIIVRVSTSDLQLLAGSVSFSLGTGASSLPPSQAVGVQSTIVAQPVSYAVSVSPPSSWLSVTGAGTTPGSLNVGLTNAAQSLLPGVSQAAITLTCTSQSCSGKTQTVTVTLTVSSPPPQLTVLSSLLAFSTSSTPPQAQVQSLGIQNTGGGTLTLNSVTCQSPWCSAGAFSASLTAGSATQVNVTVDPSTLSSGFYRTTLDVVTSAGSASVPITFFISQTTSMNLAPSGTQFTMPSGGAPGNPAGSFLVSVSGGSIGWTATVLPGASWLTLNTGSGTASSVQPGTVSYSVNSNAAGLAPQAYYATIEVASSGAVNSPQDYQVVLNVTPPANAAKPDPSPAGLLFLTTVGNNPPPQVVTVYSSSVALTNYQAAATTEVGSWLTVAPPVGIASAASPDQSTITVNAAGLAQGIYRGGVSYALASAGVSTVNVTLIVQPPGNGAAGQLVSGQTPNALAPKATCSPTSLVPTQTGLVNNFSAPASWPTPLAITLVNDCGKAVPDGQVVATFSNGDPPLALSVANGATGLYSATWTPRKSSAQVSITARATASGLAPATTQISGSVIPNATPVITPNGTVHAYNPQVGAAMAPGTLMAVYGSNLASTPALASSTPWPTVINGTSVLIGGILSPLYYVSPGQINVQIPFELDATKQYQVVVSANGALTTPQAIQLADATPGLGTLGDGSLLAVHGADGSLITQDSPAKPGEYIVMFLLGMGATDNPAPSGTASPGNPLARPTAVPTLTLGGVNVPIAFAGLTPGYVGLYQINLQVPLVTLDGNLVLTVSQDGVVSNSTILPVRY